MSPLLVLKTTLSNSLKSIREFMAMLREGLRPEFGIFWILFLFFVLWQWSMSPRHESDIKKIEGFDGVEGATETNQGLGMGQTGLSENNEDTLDSYFQEPTSVEKKYESDVKEKLESDKGVLKSSEFLPQELNVDWFDKDFNSIQEIDQETLIDVSKYSSPVDTVGQSLKNPSYDIRGNIMNPKSIISPFLNSSIEPDTNIKTWC